MITKMHKADVLSGYIAAGLTPVEAIKKLKAENQEYFPKHFTEKGEPLTFEGLISHFIRVEKMSPDRAVRTATSRSPKLQREYYERLRVGAATDSDLDREARGESLSNPPPVVPPALVISPVGIKSGEAIGAPRISLSVPAAKPVQPKAAAVGVTGATAAAPKPVSKLQSVVPAPVAKKKTWFNTAPSAEFRLL